MITPLDAISEFFLNTNDRDAKVLAHFNLDGKIIREITTLDKDFGEEDLSFCVLTGAIWSFRYRSYVDDVRSYYYGSSASNLFLRRRYPPTFFDALDDNIPRNCTFLEIRRDTILRLNGKLEDCQVIELRNGLDVLMRHTLYKPESYDHLIKMLSAMKK